MKKLISYSVAVLLMAVLVTFTSCNKSPLNLKYTMGTQSVCVSASTYQYYQVFTFTIKNSDVTSFLSANGGTTDISKVSSAVISGLVAQTATTGTDFSQITSIEAYIKPASDLTTNVGTQVAYSQGLGAGVSQITMTLDGANIQQLLSADMTLTVKVLNTPTGNNHLCINLSQGYIKLQVKQ